MNILAKVLFVVFIILILSFFVGCIKTWWEQRQMEKDNKWKRRE